MRVTNNAMTRNYLINLNNNLSLLNESGTRCLLYTSDAADE